MNNVEWNLLKRAQAQNICCADGKLWPEPSDAFVDHARRQRHG